MSAGGMSQAGSGVHHTTRTHHTPTGNPGTVDTDTDTIDALKKETSTRHTQHEMPSPTDDDDPFSIPLHNYLLFYSGYLFMCLYVYLFRTPLFSISGGHGKPHTSTHLTHPLTHTLLYAHMISLLYDAGLASPVPWRSSGR